MNLSLQSILERIRSVSLRLVIILTCFIAFLFLFFLIINEVVIEKETGFDDFVFGVVNGWRSPANTKLFTFFTFFGSRNFLFPAYILLALYFLLFKRKTLRSMNVITIGLGSAGLLFLVKNHFRRSRPLDPLIDVTGFSFPSGHSFSTFTFCGLIIYIIANSELGRRQKILISCLLLAFAGLVALSRVYLHVHYPSDVVAGFFMAFIWLAVSIFILEKLIGGKFEKRSR